MAYYNICPDCGANLDPGESCDCRKKEQESRESISKMLKEDPMTGQYEFRFDGQRTAGHMEEPAC